MNSLSSIITCYKEGLLLNRAISSLKNQTYQDFEIIIVKDFSDHEETNKICKELEIEGFKVIWCKKNIGLSGARNIGIETAKGSIIVPLDADDTLPSNAIELIVESFRANAAIDIVVGDYLKIDVEKNEKTIVDCSVIINGQNEIDTVKLLQNWILLGTSPFRKSLWKRIMGYSDEFSNTCQDVDYFMRAFLNNAKSNYVNKVIYEWYKSELGMNSNMSHHSALGKCYYNNFDFILKNASNNDAFSIALEYKDYNKLKLWSKKRNMEKQRNFKSVLFEVSPMFFVPVLSLLFTTLKQQKYIEMIRFGLVGVVATAIHYSLYLLLTTVISINIAYSIGYLTSFLFNFFISNYFTFKTKPTVLKGVGFGLSHLFNYLNQMILLNALIYMNVVSSIAPLLIFAIVIPINFILIKSVLKSKKL